MAKFNKTTHGKRNGYLFQCPGCEVSHIVLTDAGTPQWGFNGDVDHPTVTPSIRVRGGGIGMCHSFVEGGKIRFLNDCTHELAGQTVELPEWE